WDQEPALAAEEPPSRPTPRAWSWTDLLRRTFALDVLACPRCGGRMRVIATLGRHLKTGHTSTGQNRPTGSGRRDELGTTACGPPTASCGGWCGRRGGKSPHAFVRRVSPPAAGARL